MSESKIARCVKVKSRLAENNLTSQWLMLRLSKDYGIEIDKCNLSMILSGARVGGDRPVQVLTAAEEILDKYESVYKEAE